MLPAAGSDSARLGHKVWLGVGAFVVVALPVGASVFGGPALIPAGVVVAVVSAECVRRAWRRLGMGQFGVAQAWSVGAIVVALSGRWAWCCRTRMVFGSARRSPGSSGARRRPTARRRGGLPRGQPDLPDAGRLERIDDADAWLRENRTGILIVPFAASDDRPGLHKLGGVKG
jgi:hypothetical protein